VPVSGEARPPRYCTRNCVGRLCSTIVGRWTHGDAAAAASEGAETPRSHGPSTTRWIGTLRLRPERPSRTRTRERSARRGRLARGSGRSVKSVPDDSRACPFTTSGVSPRFLEWRSPPAAVCVERSRCPLRRFREDAEGHLKRYVNQLPTGPPRMPTSAAELLERRRPNSACRTKSHREKQTKMCLMVCSLPFSLATVRYRKRRDVLYAGPGNDHRVRLSGTQPVFTVRTRFIMSKEG